ncbi:predicted protein [Coccidioides posadasii str. Silveira]|uniref:Predicted protein n=1 Tax=Coccidioides posadasii (strain RMSCC 757 / Silveira) TaxID=443226 RepID=E9D9F2_COCPS|nr:predicted protein [Coccidioides posadasii str. Silveira]
MVEWGAGQNCPEKFRPRRRFSKAVQPGNRSPSTGENNNVHPDMRACLSTPVRRTIVS